MKLPTCTARALTDALRTDLPAGHSVYALIDGAHDPKLLPQIMYSGHPFACLFSETEAAHLGHAAPFLVELPSYHDLTGILGMGLGLAMYSFVRSPLEFVSLLNHLGRYTTCRHHSGNGRSIDAYFAYWDPRVAADWLPTLEGQAAEQFFGPLESFCAEVPGSTERLALYRHQGSSVAVTHRDIFAPTMVHA